MSNDDARRIRALDELRAEFVRVARSESRPPTRHRVRVIAITLAALAIFGSGAAARIMIGSGADRVISREAPRSPAATGSPDGTARPPAYAGFTQYQTVREIVANSDLVVMGTVQEVAPGYVEPDEQGFPTRYLNTVIKVDETWKGTPADTITVATNDLAYGNPGGGSEWRGPGVRVVAFLSLGDSGPPGLFYPTDEQGIYVLSGDALVPTVRTSLSDQIAAVSIEELRQAVQAAEQGA
jgi:hypothetical protein